MRATVTTGDPAGLFRADEGNSWLGNFSPGDKLLNNNSTDYFPLTLTFALPVKGAGASVQLDADLAFTATIEAFNGNTSLGSFMENGFSNGNEDGSAVFLGVLSTDANITKVVFGLSNPPLGAASDFAINRLLLTDAPPSPPPPIPVAEPSSFALLSLGAVALAGWRWRRRSDAPA
jgi:hypothetical protein